METTSRHERAKAALLILILGTMLGVVLAIPVSHFVEPRRSWTSWLQVNGFLQRRYDAQGKEDHLEWSIPTPGHLLPDSGDR